MATYIVVKGDIFDNIAHRLGVSHADLKKANPNVANPSQITPGEHIHVPGDAPNTTYHVKSGDTGTSIAQKENITFQKLEQLNPNVHWKDLQIGQTVIVPRN